MVGIAKETLPVPSDTSKEKPCNPFQYDLFHQGVSAGNRAIILWGSAKDSERYIIVVDSYTGQQMRVEFT